MKNHGDRLWARIPPAKNSKCCSSDSVVPILSWSVLTTFVDHKESFSREKLMFYRVMMKIADRVRIAGVSDRTDSESIRFFFWLCNIIQIVHMHIISEFHNIRTIITGFTRLARITAVLKKPNSNHKSRTKSNFEKPKGGNMTGLSRKFQWKFGFNPFIAASFTLTYQKTENGPFSTEIRRFSNCISRTKSNFGKKKVYFDGSP